MSGPALSVHTPAGISRGPNTIPPPGPVSTPIANANSALTIKATKAAHSVIRKNRHRLVRIALRIESTNFHRSRRSRHFILVTFLVTKKK